MTAPKPLILIVEDDKDMAALIVEHIEQAGMATQTCSKAEQVTRFLDRNYANLMLLDLNLPDCSGFALMEELNRRRIETPIIFLTATDSEASKIRALEMGGDDYITKPFSYKELIARIHAVLRRTETFQDHHIAPNVNLHADPFDFGGASVNPHRMEIKFEGEGVEKIGKKELGIISFLVSNPSTVLTRRSLIHAVWGVHADVRSRSLDQYIVKIRDTYERHSCELKAFRTIHGVGYIYDPANN